MNNFEKIKAMSIDKMAEFFVEDSPCDFCICDLDENKCTAIGCKNGIKQWLEQESEEE
jgi:hypothetical protein